MQTYRNSVGDISAPKYEFWIETEFDGNYFAPNLMITLIWLIWLSNQFLVLIILLNFLIAIISESYANTLEKKEYYKYVQRCEMNIETMIALDFVGKLVPHDYFILSTNIENEHDDSELKGHTESIKNFV